MEKNHTNTDLVSIKIRMRQIYPSVQMLAILVPNAYCYITELPQLCRYMYIYI